jgi:hypothetical protein
VAEIISFEAFKEAGERKALDASTLRSKHVWGVSNLGHGNLQCIHCLMTDLEAHVLGPFCLERKP